MEYKKIPSVTRVPLSERVYKILMESIVSGDLLPGTELREQHVAKQMGVKRYTGAEAFKRLASDGMIELSHTEAPVVKVLDQQEIREDYACREALEHLVAKEVIERVRQEDIDRLYRMIEGFRQAEGVEEIAASSQEFDEYLYQLTGNRTLCDLLALLKGVISREPEVFCRQSRAAAGHLSGASGNRGGPGPPRSGGAKRAISRHIYNGQKYIEEKR